MPYSLKQLEERRDSCIKKIQELKASAEDKGAKEFGNLNFSAVGFFPWFIQYAFRRNGFIFIIFSSIS